jgi:hypothetical protein
MIFVYLSIFNSSREAGIVFIFELHLHTATTTNTSIQHSAWMGVCQSINQHCCSLFLVKVHIMRCGQFIVAAAAAAAYNSIQYAMKHTYMYTLHIPQITFTSVYQSEHSTPALHQTSRRMSPFLFNLVIGMMML